MFRSQVTLKLRSKSLQIGASLIAGLAIMLPMQTSYAQPSYLGKISAFCTNLGSPSRITSCTDCHTSSNPSTRDATTANASRYKSGNYNSFCVVTAPAPIENYGRSTVRRSPVAVAASSNEPSAISTTA